MAVGLIADADWRRRTELADDALAMARRLGDRITLARVLCLRALARWDPHTLGDHDADLREAWQLVEQLGQPPIAWNAAVARTKHALVTSPPIEAERLAFVAYELGRRAGQPDADIWFLGAIFAARFLQGTLDGGQPNLALLFEQPGSAPQAGPEITPSRSIPLLVSTAKSVILCELDRTDEARMHLDILAEALDDLPRDYSTLPILAHAAIACAHLGDAERAAQLRALLEPHADQFVNTGGSWFGAVTHLLALLHATGDATEDADRRFAAAERAYRRLGAGAWLARCRLDWATALLSRGQAGALRQADGLLDDVLETARELDLPAIGMRATRLRSAVRGTSGAGLGA